MDLLDSTSVRDVAGRVEHSAHQLDEAVVARRGGGSADLQALHRVLEDSVLDLSRTLPAGTEDYEARRLFEFVVALRHALEPSAPDLDGALLALVQMLDVLKRLERKREHTRIEDPRQAAAFILGLMEGQPADQLADLLGVSSRTLASWRGGARPGAQSTGPLLVVAQVLMYLQTSMTPRGLLLWFRGPNDALGGASPQELLHKDLERAERELRSLARGARGQLAI